MVASAPIASIIPPKTMAHKISQMVPNILLMPPAVNKPFNASLSVGMDVSMVMAFIIPL